MSRFTDQELDQLIVLRRSIREAEARKLTLESQIRRQQRTIDQINDCIQADRAAIDRITQ